MPYGTDPFIRPYVRTQEVTTMWVAIVLVLLVFVIAFGIALSGSDDGDSANNW